MALAIGGLSIPCVANAAGAKLGYDPSAYEPIFGAGTDAEGGLIQYGSATADTAASYVRYANDVAEFIEALRNINQ